MYDGAVEPAGRYLRYLSGGNITSLVGSIPSQGAPYDGAVVAQGAIVLPTCSDVQEDPGAGLIVAAAADLAQPLVAVM